MEEKEPLAGEEEAMKDSTKQAIYNYRKRWIHRVSVDFKKADYDKIKQAATAAGVSNARYMREAILDRLYHEGYELAGTVNDNQYPYSAPQNNDSSYSQSNQYDNGGDNKEQYADTEEDYDGDNMAGYDNVGSRYDSAGSDYDGNADYGGDVESAEPDNQNNNYDDDDGIIKI